MNMITVEKIFLLMALTALAISVCLAKSDDDETNDDEQSDELSDEMNEEFGETEEGDNTDYCSPDLCAKGKRHIACKNNGDFDANCPKNRTLIPLSEDNIELIVDLHNKYRNKIASGSDPRYQPAARMSTMIWNKELAKLAVMNVKQCEMKHDECRNTRDFKFAGQNLCTRKKSKEFENLEGSIDNCITTWFNEKEFATQDDIKKCCNLESTNPIGHFTVMVNDRANAVGCGMIRFKRKGKLQTLMACNYSFTNIIDKRVYTAGKATSDCIQGANPDFDALCSETEEINNSEA